VTRSKAASQYFEALDVMRATKRYFKQDPNPYLEAGESCLSALPAFIKEWLADFGEEGLPPSIPCRDELPAAYMSLGRWEDAVRVVEACYSAKAMSSNEKKEAVAWIRACQGVTESLGEYLERNPGVLQKDIRTLLPHLNEEALAWAVSCWHGIEKRRQRNSNALYLAGQAPQMEAIEPASIDQASLSPEQRTAVRSSEDFPDWYISLSFGKSRSSNYPQAVELARMAPKYMEHNIGGKVLHQAVYSDKPSEYLQFVKLYELVSAWKSCFVVINGQVVDRKIVAGLNYCYGDRCRSGNPKFCYGASPFTENPFGCHRLQTSAWNNPWWTYGEMDRAGVWHVDKKAILARITEYAEPYRLCPAFSWETAVCGLADLPDVIDPRKDPEWVALGDSVMPKSRMEPIASYTINVDLGPGSNKEQRSVPRSAGCGCFALPVALGVFVLLIAAMI